MSEKIRKPALVTIPKGTRWTVRVADHASRVIITVGGIGTILSVSAVCVFLLWVALPLFLPARVSETSEAPLAVRGNPIRLVLDSHRLMGGTLFRNGELAVFRLDNGEILSEARLFGDRTLTAASFSVDDDSVAFGFDDGTVQFGSIGVATTYPDPSEPGGSLPSLSPDEVVAWRDGLLTLTPRGQYRYEIVSAELDDPMEQAHSSSILLIDHVNRSTGPVYCVLTQRGELDLETISERTNLLTGQVTRKRKESRLPFERRGARDPKFLLLNALGDNLFLAWEDGVTVRYDLRDPANPVVAETVDLVADESASLTALTMMAGRATLIAGDSAGNVSAWFSTRPEGAPTLDGSVLVAAHELPGGSAPVVSLSPSSRGRLLAALDSEPSVRVYYVTGDRILARFDIPSGNTGMSRGLVSLAPMDDGLVALTADTISVWELDLRYPEASMTALFRPVWYEGYPGPAHVWQSTGGTDDFEPKLGMYPLVFGTVKATFYTMIIAVPIALLAAIYTSEFLHPKVRARVKPAIELMASLPSVVLGFLAALVFAPVVERYVPEVLAVFTTIPVTYLGVAYLWQLLPRALALRLEPHRLLVAVLVLPVAILVAFPVGRILETVFFSGDTRLWLDGRAGRAVGGWFFLFLPVSLLVVLIGSAKWAAPRVERLAGRFSVRVWALGDLARFLGVLAATAILAWLLAETVSLLGFDPRGSLIGTYVQRNALIVGFVMGFAVIPIIYTIADDALNTVPDHLRSASLAAGATPWQTSIRIIVPAAMSGLFSAMMVGLGRAVGETMIVLMATGNTPVMDWNPFNGFRTLSANIAVELPEAVRDSTHYRTLFFAALLLFLMTFVVNTVAELVRLRFRKRAYQL